MSFRSYFKLFFQLFTEPHLVGVFFFSIFYYKLFQSNIKIQGSIPKKTYISSNQPKNKREEMQFQTLQTYTPLPPSLCRHQYYGEYTARHSHLQHLYSFSTYECIQKWFWSQVFLITIWMASYFLDLQQLWFIHYCWYTEFYHVMKPQSTLPFMDI